VKNPELRIAEITAVVIAQMMVRNVIARQTLTEDSAKKGSPIQNCLFMVVNGSVTMSAIALRQ
jgi:hypothetical protein